MIEEIRKIWSDDNIKEMACEYTGAEEEYQGFILGCNVLADEIEEQVKKCSIPDVVGQSEQLQSFVNGFYEWHKKQGYATVKREDWSDYIKTL